MAIRRMDHVGIVVDDLAAATEFFLSLGFEREGAGPVEGQWVDKVIGLDDVRVEMVMVATPDGASKLELTKFRSPADEDGVRPSPANRLGIRDIAFVIDDLDAKVTELRVKGFNTVGEVQNYEEIFRLCYIRGPEGIIVELAEQLG